jgi:hypothetical protein
MTMTPTYDVCVADLGHLGHWGNADASCVAMVRNPNGAIDVGGTWDDAHDSAVHVVMRVVTDKFADKGSTTSMNESADTFIVFDMNIAPAHA